MLHRARADSIGGLYSNALRIYLGLIRSTISSMSGTIYFPEASRLHLENWTADGYPEETCGLLIGRQEDGNTWIVRVESTRNIDTERSRDRFEMAPEDFLDCDRRAMREGLEVVGCWHSHPDHPARPSETDRVRAWPNWSYLIVSVRGGRSGEMRSWRLVGEQFEEESIARWEP